MTLEDLEALMQEYQVWDMHVCICDTLLIMLQDSANQGTEAENGWPSKAYSVSKASTNGLTAVLAQKNPGLTINACCPGWVSTDMGRMVGPRPAKAPGKQCCPSPFGSRTMLILLIRGGCRDPDQIGLQRYWSSDRQVLGKPFGFRQG